MEFLALVAVVVGIFVLLFAWSSAVTIWVAWWAVKIWALLVVPSMHWPPLPLAAAIGFALVLNLMHHRNPSEGSTEDDSTVLKMWKFGAPGLLGGPLVYVVARIVAHFVL